MKAKTLITLTLALPVIIVTVAAMSLILGVSAGLRHALLTAVRVTKSMLRSITEAGL